MPRKVKPTLPVPPIVSIEKIVWEDHAETNACRDCVFTLDIPQWISFGAVIYEDDKQVVLLQSVQTEDLGNILGTKGNTAAYILKNNIVSRIRMGEVASDASGEAQDA